ncbi:o-succinylbenzoate--CoA ligase [Photobacterium minamisatsumaniensis]|uniref:o-succinylbenzoate--CoA ligase n=1 Tax=Photobacterium minamisatsumaniensis TaxID=2910233 RepID=UPI003D14A8D5
MAALTPASFPTWPWLHWAAERPSEVALSFEEQQFSWAELAANVDSYAQGLLEQGVKRDQLITVIAPNSPQVVWLMLATLRVGARFVALNPRLSQFELDAQLEQLQCDFVWYPAKCEHHFSGYSRIQLLPADKPRVVPVTWQPSRAATLTMTSGSTGTPKAVVHSAQTHLASAQGLLAWLPYESGDNWLLSLPVFHISGMAILWRWLYRGAQLTVCSAAGFDRALATVTHASLVPTQLQRVLALESAGGFALKQVLLGGAAIPVSLTKLAADAGISCWCGYGMTEMASTVTVKPADASAGVGAILPNRELMLRDDEILVKGATLCLGYYRNKMVFPVSDEEWFATKDLAHLKDDELHIVGRADNMFISGGENIQPEMIEKVLAAHPMVEQAFVLPVDDSEFGQRPVAIITATVDLDEELNRNLTDYMRTQVTAFRRPIRYLTLPTSLQAGGIKVSRKSLAEWLAAQ